MVDSDFGERRRGAAPMLAQLLVVVVLALAGSLGSVARAQDEAGIDPEQGLVEHEEPAPVEEVEVPPSAEPYRDDGPVGEPEVDDDSSGGAFLLAGKVGGGVPFNNLDLDIAGALEIGYLFSRTGHSLGVLIDVSYFVPQSEGQNLDTRLTDVSAMGDGGYGWHAWQKELSIQPTLLYRLAMLSKSVVPYVGIGPRVYLLETVVDGKAGDESFPISREVSTKFGFGVPLGAEVTLGPGGVIAELLFQWGPLKHDITGNTHLASATLWVGYRALL
ncbi:MAG: hypothetical protein OEZ06_09830 [Myxococcales bacterium]|nr:hypothetical protein [Myxococcales bacterium]